MPVNYYDYVS